MLEYSSVDFLACPQKHRSSAMKNTMSTRRSNAVFPASPTFDTDNVPAQPYFIPSPQPPRYIPPQLYPSYDSFMLNNIDPTPVFNPAETSLDTTRSNSFMHRGRRALFMYLMNSLLPYLRQRTSMIARTVAVSVTMRALNSAVHNRASLGRTFIQMLRHSLYALLLRTGLGRTRVTYDPSILGLRRVMVVSNHVSVWDWLILWMVLERLGHRRVVFCARRLTGVLRPINALMNALGFAVIYQNLGEDFITLSTCARDLADSDQDYCFVLFPEGTLRNSVLYRRRMRSVSRGGTAHDDEEGDVPPLLPIKTRAFCMLMKNLRGNVQGVIDCTMRYDDGSNVVYPGPSTLLLKQVQIPQSASGGSSMLNNEADDAAMDAWLRHLFETKAGTLQDMAAGLKPVEIPYPRTFELYPTMSAILARMTTGKSAAAVWLFVLGVVRVYFTRRARLLRQAAMATVRARARAAPVG
jgi:1-acyl-sn-glycerol-3-phosphate acyltransferase